MNVTDNIGDDREGRIVFGQIDPLIRLLLASINQSSSISKSHILGGKKEWKEEETVLSNLRIQHNLLVRLTNVFKSFHSSERCKENEEARGNNETKGGDAIRSKQIAMVKEEALVKMAEYILLPLTQILRGGIGQHKSERQHNTNEGESAVKTSTEGQTIDGSERCRSRRRSWIRKSAQRKCMGQSAIALVSYLKAIEYRHLHKKTPDEDAKEAKQKDREKKYSPIEAGSRLKPHIIAQSLITCAVALQNLEDDCDDFVEDQKLESRGNDKSLDDAAACTKSILHCVESLVSYAPIDENCSRTDVSEIPTRQKITHSDNEVDGDDNFKDKFKLSQSSRTAPKLSPTAIEIINIMDGALMARLAGACLSTLVPSSHTSSQTRKPHSRQHDASLKIQSLVTLRAMMNHIPSIGVWRALFPGCFARLFKSSVSNLDSVPVSSSSSSSSTSHRVASMSIETLSCLIDLVMTFSPSAPSPIFSPNEVTKDDIGNDKTRSERSYDDGDEITTAYEATSTALAMLASMATSKTEIKPAENDEHSRDTANENHAIVSNNDDHSSSSKQQASELSFYKELSRRIPKPISTLLNMIPAHRNTLVRRSGCFLCRSVLELATITTMVSTTANEQTSLSNDMMTRMHQQDKEEENERGSKKGDDVIKINLERTAMECCLALTEDDDSLVASTSRHVMISYCVLLGPVSWKDKFNDTFVTRAVELIEELPILAQRAGGVGREADLIAQINLICGYLELAATSMCEIWQIGSEKNHSEDKIRRRRRCGRGCNVGNGLACESVSVAIRKALTATLTLDLDSMSISTPGMPLFSNTIFHHENVDDGSDSVSAPRFLYLRSRTVSEAAKKMVRLLGFVLGTKQVVAFIDNCIADLFDTCSERAASREHGTTPEMGMSLFCGSDQVDWLHKWVGSLILSNELLLGLFSPETDAEEYVSGNSTDRPKTNNNASDPQYYDTTLDRKRIKMIIKLSSSILPVMTSAPLWNLPTTADEVDNYLDYKNAERYTKYCASSDRSDRLAHTFDRTSSTDLEIGQRSVWSDLLASALNGNAILIGFLIDIVGSLTKLLGRNVRFFLSTLLYPLIEKSSHSSHYYVRKSSLIVLRRVAECTGAMTVNSLIVQNFDYLVEVMISSMQFPSASACLKKQWMVPRSLSGIVEIVLTSVVKETDAADHCTMKLNPSAEFCFGSRYVSLFGNLIGKIALSFDESFTRESDKMVLIRVFGAVIDYLQSSFRYHKEGHGNTYMGDVNTTENPWLDLLSEFSENDDKDEIQVIDAHDTKGKICPAEGFGQYHGSTVIDESVSGDRAIEKNESADFCSQGKHQSFEEEVKIANLILTRCCFFLCSPGLIIQVATCKTLVSAFGYLAAIQKQLTIIAESNESLESPLLASIGTLWPSISDRFCSAATSLTETKQINAPQSSALKLVCSKYDSEYGDETYFERLLSVISALCELSGDFMVGRIKKEIWPCIAKLLGIIVEVNTRELPNKVSREERDAVASVTYHTEPSCSASFEGKQIALHAILKFLLCVFSNKDCGNGLFHLIPVAGTMILPLISKENSAGNYACLALKSMLTVDSGGLFRALLALSGLEIPTNPLIAPNSDVSLVGISKSDDVLVRKAKQLMKYVECLPEYAIM